MTFAPTITIEERERERERERFEPGKKKAWVKDVGHVSLDWVRQQYVASTGRTAASHSVIIKRNREKEKRILGNGAVEVYYKVTEQLPPVS
mmetsp:Transcript_20413/g.30259  ORF Transcript_20413/g.30259 Transcript_20413/m.30259 type:complete len:91 (+) Transcript_20413:129-401(+)